MKITHVSVNYTKLFFITIFSSECSIPFLQLEEKGTAAINFSISGVVLVY